MSVKLHQREKLPSLIIMNIPAQFAVMPSVPWETLRFFPKELIEFKESSAEMKRTKTVYCTEYECIK